VAQPPQTVPPPPTNNVKVHPRLRILVWAYASPTVSTSSAATIRSLSAGRFTYETVMAQLAGDCKGYFLMGENPAVGSANAKMRRRDMANLEWLVVRDFSLIESATGPGWPGCTKPGSPTRGSTAVIRRTAWAATARSSCCSTSRVYGLPPDPVVITRDLPSMWKHVAAAAATLVGGALVAFATGRRL
jgi:hypothetical protein